MAISQYSEFIKQYRLLQERQPNSTFANITAEQWLTEFISRLDIKLKESNITEAILEDYNIFTDIASEVFSADENIKLIPTEILPNLHTAVIENYTNIYTANTPASIGRHLAKEGTDNIPFNLNSIFVDQQSIDQPSVSINLESNDSKVLDLDSISETKEPQTDLVKDLDNIHTKLSSVEDVANKLLTEYDKFESKPGSMLGALAQANYDFSQDFPKIEETKKHKDSNYSLDHVNNPKGLSPRGDSGGAIEYIRKEVGPIQPQPDSTKSEEIDPIVEKANKLKRRIDALEKSGFLNTEIILLPEEHFDFYPNFYKTNDFDSTIRPSTIVETKEHTIEQEIDDNTRVQKAPIIIEEPNKPSETIEPSLHKQASDSDTRIQKSSIVIEEPTKPSEAIKPKADDTKQSKTPRSRRSRSTNNYSNFIKQFTELIQGDSNINQQSDTYIQNDTAEFDYSTEISNTNNKFNSSDQVRNQYSNQQYSNDVIKHITQNDSVDNTENINNEADVVNTAYQFSKILDITKEPQSIASADSDIRVSIPKPIVTPDIASSIMGDKDDMTTQFENLANILTTMQDSLEKLNITTQENIYNTSEVHNLGDIYESDNAIKPQPVDVTQVQSSTQTKEQPEEQFSTGLVELYLHSIYEAITGQGIKIRDYS